MKDGRLEVYERDDGELVIVGDCSQIAMSAKAGGQMDAGQRGKGVTFDEVPHVMVRMCVAACILAMSGKLEELEAE